MLNSKLSHVYTAAIFLFSWWLLKTFFYLEHTNLQRKSPKWHNNSQHNDIQHYGTQHDSENVTLGMTLSIQKCDTWHNGTLQSILLC
jgi:hypothetical protein